MKFRSIIVIDNLDYVAEFSFQTTDNITLIGSEELLGILGVTELSFSYDPNENIIRGPVINGYPEITEPLFRAIKEELIRGKYI
jgi:hypothetical protein